MNEELLKKKHIRITDFRLSVLDIFLQHDNAISIELIEEVLGDHDRITLYRTLKTFVSKGLVHEIMLPGESKKLALCGSDCYSDNHNHHHIHFQCNICDEVFCLPLNDEHIIQLPGFQIDYLEVIANGTCSDCM